MFIQFTCVDGTDKRVGVNTLLVRDVKPTYHTFNPTHGTTIYFEHREYRDVVESFDVVMDKLNGK